MKSVQHKSKKQTNLPKISDFFKKLNNSTYIKPKSNTSSTIITIESDEEFGESSYKLVTASPIKINAVKSQLSNSSTIITTENTAAFDEYSKNSIALSRKKRSESTCEETKKRKCISIVENIPPKDINNDDEVYPPQKKSCGERVCNDEKVTNNNEIVPEIDSQSGCRNSAKGLPLNEVNVTPDKNLYTKYLCHEDSSPRLNSTNVYKSKSKSKKSPVKLFQKTPSKIQNCNIVMDNYVKVTPIKCGMTRTIISTPTKSTEKIQASMLQYISPSTSNRSLEAQKLNESTPTKSPKLLSLSITPKSRVKTKLHFTNEGEQISSSSANPIVAKVEESINDESSVVHSKKKPQLSPDLKYCFETEFDVEDLGICFEDDFTANEDIDKLTLNLGISQHCRVVELRKSSFAVELKLKSTKMEEYALCKLKGFWINTRLAIGDTLHVMAQKDGSSWIVDNDHGLVVYEPDLLISSTSVVNTIFCKRKSVLSDKFHGFEPANKSMVIGVLVHSLLQECLKKQLSTPEKIQEITRSMVQTRDIIRRLYECEMSTNEIESELLKFLPRIVEFMQTFVCSSKSSATNRSKSNKNNWSGYITSIEDIEENIWCPELGIKGKVDVSVMAGQRNMPLELKTGRATVSLEHRAQVLMYIMMMNKLGYKVPSGLLLYLREGVLKEISMSQNELRDILILRNELSYYLMRQPNVKSEHTPAEESTSQDKRQRKRVLPQELPEPINHHSACEKCGYNVICTAFLQFDNYDISNNKGLTNVKQNMLTYLGTEHINYFIHWSSMLSLEESSKVAAKSLHEIFTIKPKTRELKGRCISNLVVCQISEESNGLLDHTFRKATDSSGKNFYGSAIMESSYVVISTDKRSAVVSGFVSHINIDTITVSIEKNLKHKYPNTEFHIDTYDSSISQTYNLTSLALLLEDSSKSDRLRKLIIDKVVPTFASKLPKVIVTKGTPILRRLNKIQQRAVLKAIAAQDYLLIKGMPGTGKTATILALIQLLVETGKSVLITSHTHSAVDNMCIRLMEYDVDFLRLGSSAKIHPKLKPYLEHTKTKDCATPEALAEVYNNAKVIAVTCFGATHPILSKRRLDVCIVDESTQVLQSTIIRPLHSANTFILIGDPDQLPPVVRNVDAIELGMSDSLLDRLDTTEGTVTLNLNYRMNRPITDLANALTYKGKLLIGTVAVANAHLCLSNIEEMKIIYKDLPWVLNALDTSLENAVKVIDTGPLWNREHNVPWNLKNTISSDENLEVQNNCVNVHEAAVIVTLVNALLKGGETASNIGVIATYNAQVAQISVLLQPLNVDVSTVDQFQGRDKNIILYSCTKFSKPKADSITYNILEDARRLNVAVTRAKQKLIVVGCLEVIKRYKPFSILLEAVDKVHIMKLEDNVDGFNWSSVLTLESQ